MGRIRNTIVTAAIGAAIAAQGAGAQSTPDQPPPPATAPPDPPSGQPTTPAPPGGGIKPAPPNKPSRPGKGDKPEPPKKKPGGHGHSEEGEKGGQKPPPDADLPPLPLVATDCGSTVPASLIPIYTEASDKYGLGPVGPAILAAINEIESGFGVNMGPSSAGAIGWMQFMPSTWEAYGVDGDGDGDRDPWDPEDAIFAAAKYLRASGMPEDPEGAIYSYNHADWYVADVLSRAACFNGLGSGFMGGINLLPAQQQLTCTPEKGKEEAIPEPYLEAFQNAATRYDLGEDGVWALAGVAQLESNFGRGMSTDEMAARGPLGIDDENWNEYGVDGDKDGHVTRTSPADSAATLARMIWASGDLRAGLFLHNHAAWYVEEVIDQSGNITGRCRVHAVTYSIALPGPSSAPINWQNVELSNSLEVWDIERGAIDPRVLALIAAISQDHKILISSLRSDHSMMTSSGNVSNHFYGRAMDIAAIDGVPCTNVSPDGPCGRLARALATLPPGQKPTELIYCFDPDGAGAAWAQADHCDHVHAGFDG